MRDGPTSAFRRWLGGAVLAFAVYASGAAVARAEQPAYSDFERDVIGEAIARSGGGRLDDAPDGKTIERIDVIRLEVFDDRDPVPDFVNVLHSTTLERIVRQELLFDVGEPYARDRVDESARNLRDLPQLSLVLVVPLSGSRPGRVRVLVITKDVWSLRLNYNFEIENARLNYLVLNPSEDNLFGTHTRVGGLFVMDPGSYSLGLVLAHRRVAGSRIRTYAGANVIVGRASGRPEGSFGSFLYGQPLYSMTTPWAWATAAVWRDEVTRLYRGGTLLHYDAPGTPEQESVPAVYHSDLFSGTIEATRSFGRLFKYDVTFGIEAVRRVFRPRGLEGQSEIVRDEFIRDVMPVSDQRVSPFVELRAYQSEFARVLDVNTLELQEDYRLGYDVLLRVYPSSSRFASTRDALGIFSGLSYTNFYHGDGLYRLVGSSRIELDVHDRNDASLELGARWMSPRSAVGRLVYDGVLLNRYENYLRRRYYLGGDNRLRGYPSNAFQGSDVVANNVEFRSRSVNILSAHVGVALFYDAAGAADTMPQIATHQSTGVGLRILFPQANRIVFRADWGFPLADPHVRPFPGALFVTFGQAFLMPSLESPDLTTNFKEPTE